MNIEVIKWSSNKVPIKNNPPDFYLERDSWNDGDFYTYYTLHLSKKHTYDSKSVLIGGVKILKKGQVRNDIHLLPLGILEKLGDEYCSLGQSLDYYERISQIEKSTQDYILKSLNDVVYKEQIKNLFQKEEGYKISLLRNFDKYDDIFVLAPVLLSRDFDEIPVDKELKFKFKTYEMEEFIEFDFDSPEYEHEYEQKSLPNRIAVIVGKNGSGKTTLLSKISRVVFASSNDREFLKEVASIEPKGLGFPRIISISYSAFDSFQVPGVRYKEKEQISRDIEKGVGRYVFCGIRDICKELEKTLHTIKPDPKGFLKREDILNDRHLFNFLKPIDALTNEFQKSIQVIYGDELKTIMFDSVIRIISEESSLNLVHNTQQNKFSAEDLIKIFPELSTGHKFVFHSLANIVQHIEKRSLVLFDEPEIHLHPPLLAVLMKSLRYILTVKNSFMILSTHSPVIIQETLSKHVYIIRRVGNLTKVTNPKIQTFGENIGIITSHVFDLSTDITDYHQELDDIAESFSGTVSQKMSLIEELFEGKISFQARAYLLSKLNGMDTK